jgi:7 transmembrane receptor (rhodopsin family)
MPQLDNTTFWSEQFTLESSCGDYNANWSFTNCSNLTSLSVAAESEGLPGLNIPYAVMEALVATFAVIGNALVIIVFYRERRLRRRTNYYIISLALADFLVGLLGIPFAILVSLAVAAITF